VKEVGPGRYESRYGLAMNGDWTVELKLSAAGTAVAFATYRVSTSSGDIQFESGTPAPGVRAAAEPMPSGTVAVPGAADAIVIDATRRQEIGLRTEAIGKRRLKTTIRAAGKVAYDETRRTEIALKFSGWVRKIHVDYTGKLVRAGEPLLSVYSPELLTAQQELLEALRGADSSMAAAARQRLLLWDIAPARIDAIVRSGVAQEVVPIAAPMSGVVVEKNLVSGSAFTAGQTLYKIAPVNPIWVVASVYQYELDLVRERLAVPEGAVLFEGDRRMVFVDLGEGRLVPREIQLGAKAGGLYEVRDGLRAGDVVVTSGNFLLSA